jgi:hypothetical protein
VSVAFFNKKNKKIKKEGCFLELSSLRGMTTTRNDANAIIRHDKVDPVVPKKGKKKDKKSHGERERERESAAAATALAGRHHHDMKVVLDELSSYLLFFLSLFFFFFFFLTLAHMRTFGHPTRSSDSGDGDSISNVPLFTTVSRTRDSRRQCCWC